MVRRNEGTDAPAPAARKRRPGSTRKPRPASPAGLAAAPLPLPGTEPAGPGGDAAGPDAGSAGFFAAPETPVRSDFGRGSDRIEPELEALAAEIGAEFAQEPESQVATRPTENCATGPDMVTAFRPLITHTARTFGLVLERYDRAPLTADEADLAATAILELGRVYDVLDPSKMDPKTAAWFNLGVTALALAAPRIQRRSQPASDSGAHLEQAP
jgi:hypothetical protein